MSEITNDKSSAEYWNARVIEANGDEQALVYVSSQGFAECTRIGEAMIRTFVKAADKVLDVGCGYGRFYDAFKAVGADYTGIDFSEEMIKEARKRHAGGNFEVSEWHKFNGIEQYDIVFEAICSSSFPIGELVWFLKPRKGKFIIIEPGQVAVITTGNLFLP